MLHLRRESCQPSIHASRAFPSQVVFIFKFHFGGGRESREAVVLGLLGLLGIQRLFPAKSENQMPRVPLPLPGPPPLSGGHRPTGQHQ